MYKGGSGDPHVDVYLYKMCLPKHDIHDKTLEGKVNCYVVQTESYSRVCRDVVRTTDVTLGNPAISF